MKKLIIATVAVMLGVAANAAAVTWGLTSVTASPDAPAAAGWQVYVMNASTYDTFAALTADKVVDYAMSNYAYSTTTAAGRGGVINVSYKGGSFAGGETVSSYLVLFNNASADSATYFAYTATGSTTIPEGGSDMSISFGTFASATSTTGGWTAVPEPTSGLLLLLGMAGLALKRKRA